MSHAQAASPGNRTKRDTRFKPGQSGNPSGRPKKHLTDALLRRLIDPEEANAWVAALARKAKRGDVNAFREGADRTEGKVPQAHTGADGAPLIPDGASTLDQGRALLAFAELLLKSKKAE